MSLCTAGACDGILCYTLSWHRDTTLPLYFEMNLKAVQGEETALLPLPSTFAFDIYDERKKEPPDDQGGKSEAPQ